MDSAELKQIVAKYWTKKLWAVHYEMGLNKQGALRADVLCINMRSEIVVVETKSSAADYKSDHKWPRYKEYADRVYLAMSNLTYKKVKALIPKGTAVFVVDADTKAMKLVGRTARNTVDPAVRLNIMTRMAFRSADATRGKRKSKDAGPRFIAQQAVNAVYELSDEWPNKTSAVLAATRAITNYC